MRLPGIKLLEFEDVALGEGRVRAFTVFEIKRLCSWIFYKWETIDQVRFHTHAFASIAFLLWGHYHERVLRRDGSISERTVCRRWPRWLPRNYCHCITRSAPNTYSMIFAGPWQRTWWEYFPAKPGLTGRYYSLPPEDREAAVRPGHWQQYGWGRKKLDRVEGPKISNSRLTS